MDESQELSYTCQDAQHPGGFGLSILRQSFKVGFF